jgi:teichuronic acid biosynthesis glycosyltransferase TuaC
MRPYAGVFVLRQAQALVKLGHELLVLRPVPYVPPLNERWRAYRAIPDEDVVEGIQVKTIRAFFLPRSIAIEYAHFQTDARIAQIVNDFRPSVIHAHFLLPAGHLALRQAVPLVVTAHGGDAYRAPWERRGLFNATAQVLRRADAVAAVSDFIRQKVREIEDRDVDVVYNGADEGTFFERGRVADRDALAIAPDRFVIAFVGDVTPPKGVFELLRAAQRLRELNPLVLFAGIPDNGIAADIRNFQVEARVMGAVPHTHLAKVFGAADVVSLPSYKEGLPVSLCEAMLCGKPVVATDVGGIPEIVIDGETGYLVTPRNVDGLAERLERIARDSQLALRLGKAAHEFAVSRLTWAVNARQYDAIYRRVIQQQGLSCAQSERQHRQWNVCAPSPPARTAR